MYERGQTLKARQRKLGITIREISAEMKFGSMDTVRQLGRISMSKEMLDEIERALEVARVKAARRLGAVG